MVGLLSFCAVHANPHDSRTGVSAPSGARTVVPPVASAVPETTVAGAAPGTRLTRYTVDIPDDYGINVTDKPVRPVAGMDNDLYYAQGTLASGAGVQVATLESAAPTYSACLADTKFASIVYPDRGRTHCFTGRGLIAALVVTKLQDYLELDVTVWQASA